MKEESLGKVWSSLELESSHELFKLRNKPQLEEDTMRLIVVAYLTELEELENYIINTLGGFYDTAMVHFAYVNDLSTINNRSVNISKYRNRIDAALGMQKNKSDCEKELYRKLENVANHFFDEHRFWDDFTSVYELLLRIELQFSSVLMEYYEIRGDCPCNLN